jgi:hypothetical protein
MNLVTRTGELNRKAIPLDNGSAPLLGNLYFNFLKTKRTEKYGRKINLSIKSFSLYLQGIILYNLKQNEKTTDNRLGCS